MTVEPNVLTLEALRRLLRAAKALLEARENQMVTALEWRELQESVVDCLSSGRPIEIEVDFDE